MGAGAPTVWATDQSYVSLSLKKPTAKATVSASFKIVGGGKRCAPGALGNCTTTTTGFARTATVCVLTKEQLDEAKGNSAGMSKALAALSKSEKNAVQSFAVNEDETGEVSVSFGGSSESLESADGFFVVFSRGEFSGPNATVGEIEPLLLSVDISYLPLVACLTTIIVWASLCCSCICCCVGYQVYRDQLRREAAARLRDSKQQDPENAGLVDSAKQPEARPEANAVPHPIEWLERCVGGRRVPFLERQYIDFKTYWKTTHSILWIWYPHPRETLLKNARIGVTFTLVTFELLVQTLWANFFTDVGEGAAAALAPKQAVADQSPGFAGQLAVQVISGSTIATLVGFAYRPFARFLAKDEQLWKESSSVKRQRAGFALRIASYAVAIVCVGGIAIALAMLLDEYSCGQFFWQVFFPFFLSLWWSTIFPGVVFSYIGFRVQNTLGIDLDDGERQALLAVK
jgi:hypothetical protein